MSAALIGNLPQGKVLVMDGMVASTAQITSHQDCKLKDKIYKGLTLPGYYSLVGDETILFGIQWLDNWCQQNGVEFDFTGLNSLERALEAAGKIRQVFKSTGALKDDRLYPELSYVYMISAQTAINYNILRQHDKYHIQRRNHIRDNEIILNYGGDIHPVKTSIFQNVAPVDCMDVAANFITQYHAENVARSRPHLQYEFNNRFCGVLIRKEGNDLVKLPFRSFDEYIITLSGGGWDMLDSPPF
jgi:hypothetical protein